MSCVTRGDSLSHIGTILVFFLPTFLFLPSTALLYTSRALASHITHIEIPSFFYLLLSSPFCLSSLIIRSCLCDCSARVERLISICLERTEDKEIVLESFQLILHGAYYAYSDIRVHLFKRRLSLPGSVFFLSSMLIRSPLYLIFFWTL